MPYRSPRLPLREALAFFAILPLLLITLPIVLVVQAVLRLLGKDKLQAGPDYVADYLTRFVAGTEGGWDWDDFCSIPLKDGRLEAIRAQVCEFEPPREMSDDERDHLRRLLAEVEALR